MYAHENRLGRTVIESNRKVMIDYRKELSEVQYNAVTYTDGPELVIAGAGSGKTRVLTYKIAYLIEKGILSHRILALTFTNKAAKEMKERIAALVSREQSKHLVMGTFHSVFGHFLREELNYHKGILPYTSNFTIYDTDDSERVIKEIVKTMCLDPKVYTPSTVLGRISKAKNNMITPIKYPQSTLMEIDEDRHINSIFKIYEKYNRVLVSANAMDFDDLLLNTWLMFKDNEHIRQRYAVRFQYCLVDEYQDTNRIQKAILLQLTKESRMLCAVGDDAQSIYAFRGAVIHNILNYNEDYPGTVTFKLEENYRSTQTIVNAANSIIKKNRSQIYKKLFSNNSEGERLSLYRGATDRNEARYVIDIIKQMTIFEHRELSDFTILYRQNWLSRSFEDALRKEYISYRIFGGMSFYQRKEIKDLLAYFRVVVNPNDEQALRRIINYPTRGIGSTTLEKLVDLSIKSEQTLWEVLSHPRFYVNLLTKSTVTKLTAFLHQLRSWQGQQHLDAYSLASVICKESGIATLLYSSPKAEDQEKFENVQELLAGIKSFVDEHSGEESPAISLEDYIREVSLLTDEDKDDKNALPYVKLMTIHASKGLEFPVIFVVGMDEDVFPCRQSFSSVMDMEEERRLFYVAVTRAKEQCFLTGADNRFRNGSFQQYEKSSFIADIDEKYIKNI